MGKSYKQYNNASHIMPYITWHTCSQIHSNTRINTGENKKPHKSIITHKFVTKTRSLAKCFLNHFFSFFFPLFIFELSQLCRRCCDNAIKEHSGQRTKPKPHSWVITHCHFEMDLMVLCSLANKRLSIK